MVSRTLNPKQQKNVEVIEPIAALMCSRGTATQKYVTTAEVWNTTQLHVTVSATLLIDSSTAQLVSMLNQVVSLQIDLANQNHLRSFWYRTLPKFKSSVCLSVGGHT